MVRSALVGALVIAIAAVVAQVFVSSPPVEPVPVATAVVPHADRRAAELERRLRHLEAELADESDERRRLAERLDAVTAQLAALSADANNADSSAAADAGAAVMAAPGGEPAAAPPEPDGRSEMERALTEAGLDPATAAEIKQQHDALAMSEIYLRDEATRDQWLDTPRFAEEMAAIEAERRPIREEIGDDAYDRFLFALGQPNRVRVEDVLAHSPAEQAGLRTGDMVVRYGDERIFAPDELVTETRGGTSGEMVRLEVIRDGQRIEVEVPRGPLGLRIAASQGLPS